MKISGFQKFSLNDYPGKIAAIIFTQGCNFACFYCHNSELIPMESNSKEYHDSNEILKFLETRKGKLEAVSITGGEPLLQEDLEDFISEIRKMGFLIKLDSNGGMPERLEKLIKSGNIDYIAMDIKAPLSNYEKVIQRKINLENITKSIKIIIESGLEYEFRTTYPDFLVNEEDIMGIVKLIKGAKRYYLQKISEPKEKDYVVKIENLTEKLKPEMLKYVDQIFLR